MRFPKNHTTQHRQREHPNLGPGPSSQLPPEPPGNQHQPELGGLVPPLSSSLQSPRAMLHGGRKAISPYSPTSSSVIASKQVLFPGSLPPLYFKAINCFSDAMSWCGRLNWPPRQSISRVPGVQACWGGRSSLDGLKSQARSPQGRGRGGAKRGWGWSMRSQDHMSRCSTPQTTPGSEVPETRLQSDCTATLLSQGALRPS